MSTAPISSSSSSAISFDNFSFKTIGQTPDLLKRISAPTNGFQDGVSDQRASSPSPAQQDMDHEMQNGDARPQDRSKSRPSLLQALTRTQPNASTTNAGQNSDNGSHQVIVKEQPPPTPQIPSSSNGSIMLRNPYPSHSTPTTPCRPQTRAQAIAHLPIVSSQNPTASPMKSFVEVLNTRLDAIFPSPAPKTQPSNQSDVNDASPIELLAQIAATNANVCVTKAQTIKVFVERSVASAQAALNAAVQLSQTAEDVGQSIGEVSTSIQDEQKAGRQKSKVLKKCVDELRIWAEAQVARVEAESEPLRMDNERLSKENEQLKLEKAEFDRKFAVEQERSLAAIAEQDRLRAELAARSAELESMRSQIHEAQRSKEQILLEMEGSLRSLRMKEQEETRSKIAEAKARAQQEEAARITVERQQLGKQQNNQPQPSAPQPVQLATNTVISTAPSLLPTSSSANSPANANTGPPSQTLSTQQIIVKAEPREEKINPFVPHPALSSAAPVAAPIASSRPSNDDNSPSLDREGSDPGNLQLDAGAASLSPRAAAANIRHMKRARELEKASMASKGAPIQAVPPRTMATPPPTPPVNTAASSPQNHVNSSQVNGPAPSLPSLPFHPSLPLPPTRIRQNSQSSRDQLSKNLIPPITTISRPAAPSDNNRDASDAFTGSGGWDVDPTRTTGWDTTPPPAVSTPVQQHSPASFSNNRLPPSNSTDSTRPPPKQNRPPNGKAQHHQPRIPSAPSSVMLGSTGGSAGFQPDEPPYYPDPAAAASSFQASKGSEGTTYPRRASRPLRQQQQSGSRPDERGRSHNDQARRGRPAIDHWSPPPRADEPPSPGARRMSDHYSPHSSTSRHWGSSSPPPESGAGRRKRPRSPEPYSPRPQHTGSAWSPRPQHKRLSTGRDDGFDAVPSYDPATTMDNSTILGRYADVAQPPYVPPPQHHQDLHHRIQSPMSPAREQYSTLPSNDGYYQQQRLPPASSLMTNKEPPPFLSRLGDAPLRGGSFDSDISTGGYPTNGYKNPPSRSRGRGRGGGNGTSRGSSSNRPLVDRMANPPPLRDRLS